MPIVQLARPADAALARRYRDADLTQRVAAATPHELVAMLYEGIRVALLAGETASEAGDPAARMAAAARALRILDALDGTLDHGRGGNTARALAAAYGQARAIIVAASSERRADLFAAARRQLGEVGQSWTAIAPENARRAA